MELVLNNNGQTITTSLIVAEIFGKEHNKVCRDIENLSCSESFRVANFGETPDIHPQNGQTYRMYEMTKDGFSFLVMGYTGERAGKFKEDFITAFNKMEQIVKSQIPQSFSEALKLAYEQSLKIEEQQKQLEAQAPKVLFTEAVIGSSSSCLIGELAKIITQNGYEIGEKRLFKYMRENRYLGQKGERYNIPNQQYIEQGLFELKKGTRSGNNGVMHTTITTKVTGKGQVYFVNNFLATAI